MATANLTQLFATFINALHILHHTGVLDAFGHLSVRNPANASTFFMSRNLAPALASSPSDLVEYHTADASPVDPAAPAGFSERCIHSEIYKRFAGIAAVVHSHSPAVIPYGISGVPLRPVIHLAGALNDHVPVFDISKHYHENDPQDLLVSNVRLGAALAAEFSAKKDEDEGRGDGLPDHYVVLMQSHGFATCAAGIEAAVFQAVYTQLNARVQSDALAIKRAYSGSGPSPEDGLVYLTPRQAREGISWNALAVQRAWDLWVREVQVSPLYINALDP